MDKVLVIEDDVMVGDMVSIYLGEEGFQVMRKGSGEEGLDAVGYFEPDVILLDLMLPDMDGLELCKQVRKTSMVPILIVSMKNKVIERVSALMAGADDFLSKPFSLHEMSARIQALIRRARVYQESLPAGPALLELPAYKMKSDEGIQIVHLDPETRSMWVRGGLVNTTYSEFEIMTCFVKHPGRVFSREDLINTVRGFDSYVTDRAIDVHIANLRKKIEDNPKQPKRIRTVWGVGYKFVL